MSTGLDSRVDNEPRKRRDGHATGMAGEFFVMHALFRLGHLPTLTLRNAKTLAILVERKDGELRKVSVKAVRSGGKWPIGRPDAPSNPRLVYVFLIFRDFEASKPICDGGELYVKNVVLANRLECKACGLVLADIDELHVAELEPHFEYNELTELHDYHEPDFGPEYDNM